MQDTSPTQKLGCPTCGHNTHVQLRPTLDERVNRYSPQKYAKDEVCYGLLLQKLTVFV